MDELTLLAKLKCLEALRSSLHSSLRFWEWVVVVGVIIELIILLKEYRDDWRDFRRGTIHSPEKPSKLLLMIGLLGAGAVAFGIARELSVDAKMEVAETQIREVNEQLFGKVSDRVGAVVAEANMIQGQLASASRRVADLGHQVLVQGPRWVPLEANAQELIGSLKEYSGQRLVLVRCTSEVRPPEPERVQQDLLRFLGDQGAEWKVEAPISAIWGLCTNGATDAGGNLVAVSSTANGSVKTAGQTLVKVLNKFQTYTILETVDPQRRDFFLHGLGPGSPWELAAQDPTAVFILVGANPTVDLQRLKTLAQKSNNP